MVDNLLVCNVFGKGVNFKHEITSLRNKVVIVVFILSDLDDVLWYSFHLIEGD